MRPMKKVKRIIGIMGFTSFLLLFGIIGGVECDTITLIDGMVYSIVFVSFFGLSVMVNNALDELQQRYREIIKRYANLYKDAA